ncbi:DMT family transporter [Larsenimonas suaedae]|uniref:DMT family transporter n=1 Tax=Larsenimonas suaedae TaxID=1851019 RepID=A0ABU1GXN5_9GAMM|nr:DMT family transporter [Larsenimonas suaedae]MCM2971507.1 DMT family transporter [Larsenimonas suaedae]MDR5896763.1 DMT family transporter [Larsenimonas suaedae]
MAYWVVFTLLAASSQALRNAFQKRLSAHVDAYGVTLARFLWAWPLAALYLGALYLITPAPLPTLSTALVGYILGGALSQIVATVLMITLFKERSFAIGVGLARSEALLAAILGVLVFGATLSMLGWAGVVIGAVAVWVMKGPTQAGAPSARTVALGLSSGLFFAFTTLAVRQATLTLDALPFTHAAAWVLLASIVIQATLLSLWLGVKRPDTFMTLIRSPKLSLPISIASCIGSLGWFTAVSLQTVALVKTLGQVEVFFTLLLARHYLKEPFTRRDIAGLLLISVAAVLVLWA